MKKFWITIGVIVVAALAVTVGLLVHSNNTGKPLNDMFNKDQIEQTDDTENNETDVPTEEEVDSGAAVITVL